MGEDYKTPCDQFCFFVEQFAHLFLSNKLVSTCSDSNLRHLLLGIAWYRLVSLGIAWYTTIQIAFEKVNCRRTRCQEMSTPSSAWCKLHHCNRRLMEGPRAQQYWLGPISLPLEDFHKLCDLNCRRHRIIHPESIFSLDGAFCYVSRCYGSSINRDSSRLNSVGINRMSNIHWAYY